MGYATVAKGVYICINKLMFYYNPLPPLFKEDVVNSGGLFDK